MHQDRISRRSPGRYWLKSDRYTFKSVRSENTKSKAAESSVLFLSLSPPLPPSRPFLLHILRAKTIRRSVNGRLYFLSFLSTPARRSRPPERKKKEGGGSGCAAKKERGRETGTRSGVGKESGQCSRKLASKSCGRNESAPFSLPLPSFGWRPQPTTIAAATTFSRPFPSGPVSR